MSLRATASSVWKFGIFIGFAAIGGYFLLPTTFSKDVCYEIIGVASVLYIAAGILLWRPINRSAWIAIGAGNLLFVIGDFVYDLYQFVLHRATPFPSWADAFYLAGYPFLIFGVASLTKDPNSKGRTRESVADAAIIAIGALAISWHFFMGQYAATTTIGTFGRLVNLAYPILDVAVLFMVIQGLIFGGSRKTVHTLIAMSLIAMVITDFAYDILLLHGSYSVGSPVNAGWMLSYILIGTAALHPSIAQPNISTISDDRELKRRLPAIAVAGLMAPAILRFETIKGNHDNTGALALFATLAFALVVIRMWWMLDRLSDQSKTLEATLLTKDNLEEELRHRALHDSLTGLANRELLQERVAVALDGNRSPDHRIAMCFCDLDNFKTINDSLGHLIGDAMLVTVAQRLLDAVRPDDLVARLSGDEFAVLMENVTGPEAAASVAERIVAILHDPIRVEDREIALSVSVGVAIADTDTTTEMLLSQADSAMYAAKAAGRDRMAMFEQSMFERTLERLEITSAFGDALRRSEFLIEFQPQYSLDKNILEGFEALVRWLHPVLGLLEPQRFISLAEESGHIVQIGEWVLEQACEQAAQWSRIFRSPLGISVNLSGRQLDDARFLDHVRSAIFRSGIDPGQLVLEFNENALAADTVRSRSALTDLKSLGLRLAIDDFGLGYSSLTYLRQFPIDILKIDKSFVDPLAEPSDKGKAFITTIVDLAHNLSMATVAEGVEHEEQRRELQMLGCDSAMGFFFSPPLSPTSATDLVIAARTAPEFKDQSSPDNRRG